MAISKKLKFKLIITFIIFVISVFLSGVFTGRAFASTLVEDAKIVIAPGEYYGTDYVICRQYSQKSLDEWYSGQANNYYIVYYPSKPQYLTYKDGYEDWKFQGFRTVLYSTGMNCKYQIEGRYYTPSGNQYYQSWTGIYYIYDGLENAINSLYVEDKEAAPGFYMKGGNGGGQNSGYIYTYGYYASDLSTVFKYASKDIYIRDEDLDTRTLTEDTMVFQQSSLVGSPTLVGVTPKMMVTGVMGQIMGVLPILIGLTVGFLALRKALAKLRNLLQQA